MVQTMRIPSRIIAQIMGGFLLIATAPTAQAVGPNSITLPSISGNLVVGQVLAITPGTWDVAPSSILYQWF